MPIILDATDARLDRLVQVAGVSLGTDVVGGPPYSAQRLGVLVTTWDITEDLNTDPASYLLTKAFPINQVIPVTLGRNLIYYFPVDGTFPTGTALRSGDETRVVSDTVVPAIDHSIFLVDVPTRDLGGNLTFENGRTPAGYQEQSFEFTGGVPPFFRAGVTVILAAGETFPGFAQQLSIFGEDGGLNAVLGEQVSRWAQLVDGDTLALQQPDGVQANEILFEETRSWIMRQPVDGSSVVVDDGETYSVTRVSGLDRNRYYLVTGARRYVGVSI